MIRTHSLFEPTQGDGVIAPRPPLLLVTSPCLNLSRGPVGHVTGGSTNLAVRLVPRGCDGDGDRDRTRASEGPGIRDPATYSRESIPRARRGPGGGWTSRRQPAAAVHRLAVGGRSPPRRGSPRLSPFSPPPIQTSGPRASSPTTLFHRYVIVDASPLANACRTSRNRAQSAMTRPWHTAASVVQTAASRLPAAIHWKTCIAKGDVTGNESIWCPGRSEHHPSFVVR